MKILMHWSLKNPIGNYCISKFALVQPIFQNLSTAKKKFNSVKTPTSIDLIESNYQFQTVVVCYPLKILTFNYDNFARRKWKQWWISFYTNTWPPWPDTEFKSRLVCFHSCAKLFMNFPFKIQPVLMACSTIISKGLHLWLSWTDSWSYNHGNISSIQTSLVL